MFRIFSYLSDEPEQQVANSKERELLETTGYNKEAIDGLKQLIRDKDAQLQSIESHYQQQMETWKTQWIEKQLEAQATLTSPPTQIPISSGPTSEEYDSLQASLTQEKQNHTQTVITLQQTQQQVASLQQQLDMLQGEGLHVSGSPPVSGRNSRVAELEREIVSLKQSLQQSQQQAEQAAITENTNSNNDDDSQQHISHLQSQLDAQQHHIQHLDELIAQHDMTSQSWQQREHQYNQDLTSMRHELEQYKQNAEQAQQQLQQHQQQQQQQQPLQPSQPHNTEPDPQLIATLQQQQQMIESLQAQLQQKAVNEQQMHAKVSQKLDQVRGMLSRKDAHIEALKQQLIAAGITPAPAPAKAP